MPSSLSRAFFGFGCFTQIFGIILLGILFYNRSFALGTFAIVSSFVVMLLLVGSGVQLEQKQKGEQLEFLRSFQPDQFDKKTKSYTSYDLLTKIAIDEQRQLVYIWTPDQKKAGVIKKAYAGMPYIIHTYSYSEIAAIILKEENHRTAVVQRDTHSAHFLLNKLKEEEDEKNKFTKPPVDKVSSMELEVIVDDTTAKRHVIRFYHVPYLYIRKDSPEYKAYFRERQECFTKLQVIIEQQNEAALKIERPIEAVEPALVTVPVPSVEDTAEKTKIVVDLNTTEYSLQLHEESKDYTQSELIQTDLKTEQAQEEPIEKPLSYFEQLVEKNRRQLHGNSTDDPK